MPLCLAPAGVLAQAAEGQRPQNVILFVADGFGPASVTMARDYVRDHLGEGDHLALDEILVGSVRTFSTSSRVTDSAAGATAFSAGVKTYNGAVAVDTLGRPVATLLEAAEARGMATGLVATSTITHATPAAFSAHVASRNTQDEIAAQQLGQGIEVLFGGGREYFLPAEAGGGREDERDLLEEARAAGYEVVLTRQDFEGVRRAPVLGLFTMGQMSFEIDRDVVAEPSLAEMTVRAIELLADDPDGFFLMVEGSRIDHAAHVNDAAAHLQEVLAFDRAVAAALDFAREDGRTLVVSVSDHETGGLTLGRNLEGRGVYEWRPSVLAAVRKSHGRIIAEMLNDEQQSPAMVLRKEAGIEALTAQEEALLQEALTDNGRLNGAISDIIGRRAVVGWTTLGHTAVDVNLYAYGPGQERFLGNHDNTFVGRALADLLGFDLAALTKQLRQAMLGSN